MAYFGVVIDGFIQSAPGEVQLRGPLDVGVYVINFNEDAIVEPADGFALQTDDAGDDRGAYAVDLQHERADDDQVASGDYGVILGGRRNTAEGANAVVGGGQLNNCSGNESVVMGGMSNVLQGDYGVIAGGSGNRINTGVAGNYNAIGGGAGNRCYEEAEYSVFFGGLGGMILIPPG